MIKETIYSLVFITLANVSTDQTKLYEQATGENLEAYKHDDKFTSPPGLRQQEFIIETNSLRDPAVLFAKSLLRP